ncbi:hypothetical protein [Hymenobacter wooponensis]|uniref:HNH nuclease domain-containing protein n=1 Tax=Hymenobacter wooponensis TaxID=1525360 RepID=A0A4Z0MC13_9BACT|nr:hypothetical protein [Hymenobacter wooponensis]TGD76907.1 hypothetical protein EU557_24920 [Hymenobacter wooponensis]
MIYLERPPAPAFLLADNNKWLLEIEQAKTHYANGIVDSFKFNHYSDSLVKDELKKVFPKCAYCESSYGAVFDGDVEHFRPKGQVNEKSPKAPGYYWLANDWDNLFLACQHCNQRRRHLLDGANKPESLGKLDQFPLKSERYRLKAPTGNFAREEEARLLLNPCKDDPKVHLAYEPEEAVVVALTVMGAESVKVFALQRPLLVQERKKRLYEVSLQLKRVKRALERMNRHPTDPTDKDEFEEEFAVLLGYTDTNASYAGMCRFFIRKFLKDNNLLPQKIIE